VPSPSAECCGSSGTPRAATTPPSAKNSSSASAWSASATTAPSDDRLLVEPLAKLPGGALGLAGRAATFKKQVGKQLPHCVAATVVDIYNAGRRGNRLDSWWK